MTPRVRLAVSAVVAGVLTICGADAQQWPGSRPPGPLAARPVDFPPYEIKTLANGLQVLVVLHHEQPSVSFRLMIRAGAMNEPADKPGVANFAAGLLNQGTKTRDAGEIANLIESAGGIIGNGSGNELTFVSGAVIKDQTDLMLSLAADMVQNPAFSQGEIDRRRSQTLSSLEVSYDDPEYLANLVFSRLVFGFHPYGRPAEGTRESITRLTRDDLVAYHRTWFVPNNALLAIVGDIKADEALAAAQKAFGGWEKREIPVLKPIDPPPPTRRLVVIDRPGSAQTEIRVGHIAVPRTHQEHVPLDLAIRILGGEGANRLFGVLRSERGLTYGASADFNAFKTSGEIVAETDTRSAATGEALRLTVDEFSRLLKESVNPLELRGAQDFLAGNFALTIEAPGAIAQQVLAHMFFGLDLSEIETYRDRVERVTTMDIQRVAKQFVKPDQLSIVLVGDASTFAAQLKSLGFADFERIPLAELDLNSPTLRRQARQPDQPPTQAVTADVPRRPGPAPGADGPRVMVSCGEASGDLYAGGLVSALRQLEPGVDVFGFGGPRMAAAGARLSGDFRGFSVTGLVEALRVVPRSWRMLRRLGEEAARLRPDVFVAIDFPDFNFRLLPVMKKLGIPVVYYVSPQLWAWREGRIETLKKHVDRMLVIFPFETEMYQKAGVPVEFVGHPMVDLAVPTRDRLDVLGAAGLDSLRPVVALLPGSRRNELTEILPTLAEAALLLSKRVPGVQFLVARAPSLDDILFAPLVKLRDAGLPVAILNEAADDVLAAADVVVTASGTATIQAALHGRPMVIVYRLAPLTYGIARRFVRVNTYGMVNLVAGQSIVPELIQHQFKAEAVAAEVEPLLKDGVRAGKMRQALASVRVKLGAPGASGRAAAAILRVAASGPSSQGSTTMH